MIPAHLHQPSNLFELERIEERVPDVEWERSYMGHGGMKEERRGGEASGSAL